MSSPRFFESPVSVRSPRCRSLHTSCGKMWWVWPWTGARSPGCPTGPPPAAPLKPQTKETSPRTHTSVVTIAAFDPKRTIFWLAFLMILEGQSWPMGPSFLVQPEAKVQGEGQDCHGGNAHKMNQGISAIAAGEPIQGHRFRQVSKSPEKENLQ